MFISSLLTWIESPHVTPLITRLGEFTYHLGLLVPSILYVKPTGIYVRESLEAGMQIT